MKYFLSKYLFPLGEDIVCSSSKDSQALHRTESLFVWAPRRGLEIWSISCISVWILGHRGDSWDMKYFLSKYLFPLCEDIICSSSKDSCRSISFLFARVSSAVARKVPKHYIERKFVRLGTEEGSWDMKYLLYFPEHWPACQIIQSTTMYSILSSATMLLYLAVQLNVPAMELSSCDNHRHHC